MKTAKKPTKKSRKGIKKCLYCGKMKACNKNPKDLICVECKIRGILNMPKTGFMNFGK